MGKVAYKKCILPDQQVDELIGEMAQLVNEAEEAGFGTIESRGGVVRVTANNLPSSLTESELNDLTYVARDVNAIITLGQFQLEGLTNEYLQGSDFDYIKNCEITIPSKPSEKKGRRPL